LKSFVVLDPMLHLGSNLGSVHFHMRKNIISRELASSSLLLDPLRALHGPMPKKQWPPTVPWGPQQLH
ncbi:hypothetical protein HAX54_029415, partial [Datura stramonium]|nr:hypothetical protein [Datura stramonium]